MGRAPGTASVGSRVRFDGGLAPKKGELPMWNVRQLRQGNSRGAASTAGSLAAFGTAVVATLVAMSPVAFASDRPATLPAAPSSQPTTSPTNSQIDRLV